MAPVFLMLGIGEVPTLLLWYGLYFGILGRDCAEIASDWMVCDIAYDGFRRKGSTL